MKISRLWQGLSVGRHCLVLIFLQKGKKFISSLFLQKLLSFVLKSCTTIIGSSQAMSALSPCESLNFSPSSIRGSRARSIHSRDNAIRHSRSIRSGHPPQGWDRPQARGREEPPHLRTSSSFPSSRSHSRDSSRIDIRSSRSGGQRWHRLQQWLPSSYGPSRRRDSRSGQVHSSHSNLVHSMGAHSREGEDQLQLQHQQLERRLLQLQVQPPASPK